ncbi:DUF6988 family protein [Stenotrophomonas maltophilia]|uniref:DUF6988 family protein n=1 Tax=Stenotrophomonas maltophilia TaxID=40324 RepID=UPI003D18E6D2
MASLLEGSLELLGEIQGAWIEMEHGRDRRSTAVSALCQMSLEHALAVQSLIATLPQSAISLVRPQYEALVRATWACHAATDTDIEKLLAPLTLESQQAAKRLPGVQGVLPRYHGRF